MLPYAHSETRPRLSWASARLTLEIGVRQKACGSTYFFMKEFDFKFFTRHSILLSKS